MADSSPPYRAQLQGVLTLTKSGEWWHEGRPFENARLAALFHRSIVWDAEQQRYLLAIGREQATFFLEDTPYFVDAILTDSAPWLVTLRDGSTHELRLESLCRGRNDQLYCAVSKPQLAYARFSRGAYQQIVSFADDDGALRIEGQRVALPRLAPIVIIMGVMGVGKSTVAAQLAATTDARMVEADDLHSETNRAKLSHGTPLTDDDRAPWLRAVREAMTSHPLHQPVVVACSALREEYRQQLKHGNPRVAFVFLDAPQETVRQRLLQPRPSIASPTLLESQFATLEPPRDALRIDATRSPQEIVQQIREQVFPAESG